MTDLLTWARQQEVSYAPAKTVLFALVSYANDEDQAWPSQETLSEATGYGLTTIKKAIKELVRLELITRETSYTGGKGKIRKQHNVYSFVRSRDDSTRKAESLCTVARRPVIEEKSMYRREVVKKPDHTPAIKAVKNTATELGTSRVSDLSMIRQAHRSNSPDLPASERPQPVAVTPASADDYDHARFMNELTGRPLPAKKNRPSSLAELRTLKSA